MLTKKEVKEIRYLVVDRYFCNFPVILRVDSVGFAFERDIRALQSRRKAVWLSTFRPVRFQNSLQLMAEDGPVGVAAAVPLLLNIAMVVELSGYILSKLCAGIESQCGSTCELKDATVKTRLGALPLKEEQNIEYRTYPQTFEKGLWPGRATLLEELFHF